MSSPVIPWLDQCRADCRRIKAFSGPITWSEKPARKNALVTSSQFVDQDGILIEGLSFAGEFEPRRMFNYLKLALMRHCAPLTPGERAGPRRVLMLEVYPSYWLSHSDDEGEIFGPHIHLGTHERGGHVARSIRCKLEDHQHLGWFLRLARHGKITQSPHRFLTIEGPLFGPK